MKLSIKKLGAALTVIATSVFLPVTSHAQTLDDQPTLAEQQVATDAFIPPYEPDHYRQVDTSDWDFNEPGMNKNNIDNHELERTLPADLGDPQPVITPGKMRSDRIPLPQGVTKEEADLAEVQEAREQGITAPGQPLMIRTFAADNCRTYWPSSFQVCGAIRAKYESMAITWAGQTPVSFLGLPKSNELTNPDGVGKRTEFQNGFIYWHPDTGAWSVTSHNSIVWARNGWELGRLGYPTSDEIGTGDGVGRKQYFQRGRIYGSLSGVVSIEGKILEKWVETGEERGPLGYPATDEEGTPDGIGRYNRFALGMIYWHPNHGAHPITGDKLFQWTYSGYEQGVWGYPTGDSTRQNDGWFRQEFEKGPIYGEWENWIFQPYNPLIGLGTDSNLRATYSVDAIKGNDYTNKIVLRTKDKCGTERIVRRGYWNGSSGFGWDKLVHKHGLFSKYSLLKMIQNSCENRYENDGIRPVYETSIHRAECSAPFMCQATGEWFVARTVFDLSPVVDSHDNFGLVTSYPITGSGSPLIEDQKYPEWFSTELPFVYSLGL
ncbi:LGFP repeat-containing protein [Corynebacterium epidermidicanis]|uniref:LGFP repeat protein n=1 Tax=Corynebacterium epidermidicanis TaxID=1050174 RepID=A0A0G3GSC6_9CORY|nr:LGFP repeat-containing protein [Corynebacterium epidermidicanis]AKK04039.1 LGFP repeat protein [Corynebacterium epidermidicanis]